ncbi:chaperonin GroEL [Candidatus Saccharibacteria bacterium]|nr:chaperonin GroEL [Candidatus Saccharibacteria bacterium]
MSKKVFYDDDARARVLGGARALYDAVKVTMGPKGRNVVIQKSYGAPTISHDGVTVAEGIELPEVDDETLGYKVGADLIKQAASKMNKVAGDGTTTVTVLTYNILNEANRLIAAGHNPMELRKGVEEAGAEVLKALEKMSEPVTGKKGRVAEVAAISAGDASIGELIADVIDKVGASGVVTVEEGQGLKMESEVVEGFTFDRGYSSALMVTDVNRQEAEYKNPAIVITDKKISSVAEISPLIERIAQSGKKDLVLIAEDVEGEALAMLVLNKLRGAFNTVAVKAPAFGDRRKETLQDIAVLTGATVISEDLGLTFENADLGVIGKARKVLVSKDATTIIEGGGSVADVANRVAQVREQAAHASSEYDKEQYEKRAAALEGKVAVIKVGGATETEIEEKKYRVDDAVAATKAALAEGIVAGGGVTLVNLSDGIVISGSDPEAAGRSIVKQALLQPFRQLMVNAGLNAEALLAQVQGAKSGQGVNVMKPGKLVDLKTDGVVDPVAVTRQAIQNAVSIAATAMTMGALVVDVPKEESAPAGSGMPGGMGY